VALASWCAVATTGAAAQGPAPTSTAILEAAAARYEALAGFCANFRQRVDVGLLGETKESSGVLCQAGSDRFEQRFTDPAGDRIVADGAFLWVFFQSVDAGQVTRTRLAQSGRPYDLHGEFLSNPGERYESFVDATDLIDGRQVWVVSLRPRTPSPYRSARVWIDRADSLIRRIVIEEDSEYVRTLDFSGIRLNPTLGADWFRFIPPTGVQVIEP
jgi:outer membrane lipoprotein carrier protein